MESVCPHVFSGSSCLCPIQHPSSRLSSRRTRFVGSSVRRFVGSSVIRRADCCRQMQVRVSPRYAAAPSGKLHVPRTSVYFFTGRLRPTLPTLFTDHPQPAKSNALFIMKSHRLISTTPRPGSRVLFLRTKTILLFGLLSVSGFLQFVRSQSVVTSPGDPVIGGQLIGGVFTPATEGTPIGNANMFPSNARPGLTIDGGLGNQYRNFGEVNTGFVVTPFFNPFDGGTLLTRIRFATGNSAPERDPLTFTLEGTNGDPLTGVYTLITSGTTGFDSDPGRSSLGPAQTFQALGAFTSYRVIFPTIRDSSTGDSMQIGEVALIGIGVPEPSTFGLAALGALALSSANCRRKAKLA
jgi:PEP-CTERM motif